MSDELLDVRRLSLRRSTLLAFFPTFAEHSAAYPVDPGAKRSGGNLDSLPLIWHYVIIEIGILFLPYK